MNKHPDSIKGQLSRSQYLVASSKKPVSVSSTAYPLVDSRGKPLKIGDEVAVSKERAFLCYHKIKDILEQEMMIRENVPRQVTNPVGYVYTTYDCVTYPTDIVTYILVLDSRMSIRRSPSEVLLLA